MTECPKSCECFVKREDIVPAPKVERYLSGLAPNEEEAFYISWGNLSIRLIQYKNGSKTAEMWANHIGYVKEKEEAK